MRLSLLAANPESWSALISPPVTPLWAGWQWQISEGHSVDHKLLDLDDRMRVSAASFDQSDGDRF